MRLTILGSGTSVPHARRAASAYWLETKAGRLLLDVGADTAHRMAGENLAWPDLDAVWISHFHLDHIGGLPALLFGMKYAPQTQARRKPLPIYGPRGLRALIEAFDAANDYGLLKQPFPVEIHEIAPNDEFEILPAIKAETFSTPHTSESLALRLADARGSSLVYTSDTGYTDALGSFAREANLFLLECSFPYNKPVETHLELGEACELARLAEAHRTVLVHLYPDWDTIDFAREVKNHYDGEMLLAHDGMVLEV